MIDCTNETVLRRFAAAAMNETNEFAGALLENLEGNVIPFLRLLVPPLF